MNTAPHLILYEGFVLCDEVRVENNSKLLFIGVYSDVIEVAALPLTMKSLGVVVKARVMAAGEHTFSLAVRDPHGNEILNASGGFNFDGSAGTVAWLPVVVPATLTTEGPFSIVITLGDLPPVNEMFTVRKRIQPASVQFNRAVAN